MFKKFLTLISIIFFQQCFALNFQVNNSYELDNNIYYSIYNTSEFPLIAHVTTLPLDAIDIKLIPAHGQREEVSSMAKRTNAFIAINGSNYRRGGKYNGNRVNLFYLNKKIYTDLKFIRGSFGWKTKNQTAIIDKIFLDTKLFINNKPFPIDQINQPRMPGKSILYTNFTDKFLLLHSPGKNIIINNNKIIENITYELPDTIPNGWYIYQVDKDRLPDIQKGMNAEFTFKLRSSELAKIYNDYDFIIGGAGLLIQNNKIVCDQLYNEFNQGTEIVHCNDEVAADFHTKIQQEWLIEKRHPRTAIGITNDNKICIIVVEGRSNNSEGLTLKELALFMQQLGCHDALNLGGGGCSTLCIKNKVINNPATYEERPVSEALCFFKK